MKHNADAYVVELSRDAFGSGWTLADDRRFWKRMHGLSGLLHLWRDAKKFTTFCLQVSEQRSDRDFLVYRLHLMTICIFLSFLESVPRIIWRKLPHFFAKFAAQMFCEILSRAELVAEENACALTGVFGEETVELDTTPSLTVRLLEERRDELLGELRALAPELVQKLEQTLEALRER